MFALFIHEDSVVRYNDNKPGRSAQNTDCKPGVILWDTNCLANNIVLDSRYKTFVSYISVSFILLRCLEKIFKFHYIKYKTESPEIEKREREGGQDVGKVEELRVGRAQIDIVS